MNQPTIEVRESGTGKHRWYVAVNGKVTPATACLIQAGVGGGYTHKEALDKAVNLENRFRSPLVAITAAMENAERFPTKNNIWTVEIQTKELETQLRFRPVRDPATELAELVTEEKA